MSFRHHLLPACFLVAALPFGCSSPGSEDESPPPIQAIAHKETSFRADWKSGTVVLDDAQVAASLLDPNADDGVYRFRRSPDIDSKLAVGKVLLLTGVNLVRITEVESSADTTTIRTEPAALADAADDADLEFKLTGVLPVLSPPTDVKPSGLRLDGALRPQGTSIAPDGTSASFQGTVNGFGVAYKSTWSPTTVNTELTVDYAVGDGKLKLVGTAAMNSFNAAGKIAVKGGATRNFDLDLDGLDVTFTLDAGAVLTGKGLERINVPLQVRIPFLVGPIPMYLGLGVEVEIESLIGPQSTLFFQTKCTAKGRSTLRYDGTTVRPTGSLEGIKCTAVPKNYVAAGLNVGLGVRVDLPKISLGVGLGGVGNIPVVNKAVNAAVEGYVSHRHEAVGNVAVRREAAGSIPVITGTCFKLDVNEGLFVGGVFRLAGIEMKHENQIYGREVESKQVGTGKGCTQ